MSDNIIVLKDIDRCLVKHDKTNNTIVKNFRGRDKKKRFENEVAILQYLESKGCECVPKLLDSDSETLTTITTYVGEKVFEINEVDHRVLHNRVEAFGVSHNDRKLNPDQFSPDLVRRIHPINQVKNEDGTYTMTYEAKVKEPRTINTPKNIVQNEEGEYYLIDFEFANLDE